MDGDQISPRKISYAKPLHFKPKPSSDWNDTSDYTPPRKSSLVKPFNFRNFDTQNTELSESIVGSYNHEGGDRYFQIQEMEYTVRRKFKVYSFMTWLYLIATIGALLFLAIGQIKNLRYLNIFPLATIFLLYLTDSVLIVGIFSAIYARTTEEYGKNKIFIYTLLFTGVVQIGSVIYEIYVSIARGRIVTIMFYQLGLFAVNIYFLLKAQRILTYHQEIQRMKDELQGDHFYKPSDSMIASGYIL